ncbi:MAG: S1 RNA-binding domain-containing protein [Byssovorax sp.]
MSTPSGNADSFANLFEQSSDARRGRREYRVGEQVEVTIVAIARDAVFAELGGKQEGVFERIGLCDADGKIRIEVGGRVSAVVGSIDKVTGQVKLNPVVIRNADADIGVARASSSGPAGSTGPVLVEGARVKGKITGLERYGIFVQIEGTFGRSGRGLVPSQETGTSRGADLKKHFSIGQDIDAKILAIDETGKIRLSIAALGADDERGLFEAFKSGQSPEATPADATATPQQQKGAPRKDKKPEPRNFGTLADLLSKTTVKAAPAAKPAAPAKPAADTSRRGPAPKR